MVRSSNKPKVFVDADVIFAGAAAPTEHGANHVMVRMGETALIDCVSSIHANPPPIGRGVIPLVDVAINFSSIEYTAAL